MAIVGVVVGVCLLIIASIVLYFGLGWRNGRKEERLRAQWDNPGRYGSRWDPELQSPTPTTRGPSFSTGPTLVTNLVFQPFVSLFVFFHPCEDEGLNGVGVAKA